MSHVAGQKKTYHYHHLITHNHIRTTVTPTIIKICFSVQWKFRSPIQWTWYIHISLCCSCILWLIIVNCCLPSSTALFHNTVNKYTCSLCLCGIQLYTNYYVLAEGALPICHMSMLGICTLNTWSWNVEKPHIPLKKSGTLPSTKQA